MKVSPFKWWRKYNETGHNLWFHDYKVGRFRRAITCWSPNPKKTEMFVLTRSQAAWLRDRLDEMLKVWK